MKYLILICFIVLQISCQTCSITQTCDSLHTWNPHVCKCCCTLNTCVFPRQQDPIDCSCKCPRNHQWDQATNTCVCINTITCPAASGRVFSPETCTCTLPSKICPPTKNYDSTSNTCVCIALSSSCASPKILNPNNCQCVCPNSPSPISCTTNQVWNKSTCSCQDTVVCTYPKRRDRQTNTCVCVHKCGPNKTQNADTCQCS